MQARPVATPGECRADRNKVFIKERVKVKVMATFYGQVRGRAESYGTRLGTKTSGIESSVQSWEGSIITKMYYNKKDELMVNIETADGSNFCGQTIFNGTFEEYKKKLNS